MHTAHTTDDTGRSAYRRIPQAATVRCRSRRCTVFHNAVCSGLACLVASCFGVALTSAQDHSDRWQVRPQPATAAPSTTAKIPIPTAATKDHQLINRMRLLARQVDGPRTQPSVTSAAATHQLQKVPRDDARQTTARPVTGSRITPTAYQTPAETPAISIPEAEISRTPPPTAQQTTQPSAPAFLDLTTNTTSEAQAGSTEPSDTDLFIRFGIWTVIILCFSGLTVLAIRRWQRSKGILPQTNSQSRILETVALGPNRSVSLIQLRDVRAIVGCDGTGVRSIVVAPESFDNALTEVDHEDTEGRLAHVA